MTIPEGDFLAADSDLLGPDPGSSCAPKGVQRPRIINAQSLFAGCKLVVIDHAGKHYRLTVTKNDKLILQK